MTNECCVARKALEEIRFHVKSDPQMERTHYSVNRTGAAEMARLADAALAAPSECAQLREKLAVAEAKIEALIAVEAERQSDTEILDWMQKHQAIVSVSSRGFTVNGYDHDVRPYGFMGENKDLRTAAKTAIESMKGSANG